MREESFWREVALPRLSPRAIVAINVIADQKERAELRSILDRELQTHDVWCCEVPEIANVSDHHCIMFATPRTKGEDIDTNCTLERFREELDKFDYVDMPKEWLNEIEQARTFRYYTSYFDSCNYSNQGDDDEEKKKK